MPQCAAPPTSSRSEPHISGYGISTLRYSELSAVVNSESCGRCNRVCQCLVGPAVFDIGVAECQRRRKNRPEIMPQFILRVLRFIIRSKLALNVSAPFPAVIRQYFENFLRKNCNYCTINMLKLK